jgi:septum formation protein
MLQPVMHILSSQRIVLASASPRRKQILENIGLKFEVVSSSFEENIDKTKFTHPYEYAMATAAGKCEEVARRLYKDEKPPDLVIGADTVLSMDNAIYEKPNDKEHAFKLLSGFSGRSHIVHTGVVLMTPRTDQGSSGDSINNLFHVTQFYESTLVNFATLDAETITSYVDTGEPMDKAGGYGIQATGGTLIEGINGDYFNVMGFPLYRFAKNIRQIIKDKHIT